MRVALILSALSIASCAPGTQVSVAFDWDPEVRLEDPAGLQVQAIVQGRDSSEEPMHTLTSATDPLVFPFELQLERVPYGDERRVLIEIRGSADLEDRPLYFGLSEIFSLRPSESSMIAVRVSLKSVPELDPILPLQWVRPNLWTEDGYLDRSIVDLVLRGNGATQARISNFAHFPESSTRMIELRPIEHRPDRVDEFTLSGWDLDLGYSGRDRCSELDSCARRVFMKLRNDDGYESEIAAQEAIVDLHPPAILDATITPTVAGSDTPVLISVVLSEAVRPALSGLWVDHYPQSAIPLTYPSADDERPTSTLFYRIRTLDDLSIFDEERVLMFNAVDLAGNFAGGGDLRTGLPVGTVLSDRNPPYVYDLDFPNITEANRWTSFTFAARDGFELTSYVVNVRGTELTEYDCVHNPVRPDFWRVQCRFFFDERARGETFVPVLVRITDAAGNDGYGSKLVPIDI